MKNNKRVLLVLLCATILSLIVTFIFSLALSLDWKELSWLSYDFLFALFGGVFSSLSVAMIVEFCSYKNNKFNTETRIIETLIALYSNLHIQNTQCLKFLNDKSQQVNINLFENLKLQIVALLNNLGYIEYSPIISRDNIFYDVFSVFLTTKLNECNNYVNMFKFYDYAINTIKLEKAKQGLFHYIPKIEDKLISIALKKILEKSNDRLKDIDDTLKKLPNKRTKWNTIKNKIVSVGTSFDTDEQIIRDFFCE